MTYGAAIIAVVCFVVALDRLGVFAAARRALGIAREASRVMSDPSASDDVRERSVRAASLALFRCFGSIAVRSAAAVAASVLPVVLLQAAGLVHLPAVNRLLLSWRGLLLASGTVAFVQIVRSRL